MNFDEYQQKSQKYDLFELNKDLNSPNFLEKVLGLSGETGETADKIKKILRDKAGKPTPEDIDAIKKELGDVLWYLANIARYLDIPFSEVAKTNLNKLESRYNRNQLHGSGDER